MFAFNLGAMTNKKQSDENKVDNDLLDICVKRSVENSKRVLKKSEDLFNLCDEVLPKLRKI
jgi:hypothetical protein